MQAAVHHDYTYDKKKAESKSKIPDFIAFVAIGIAVMMFSAIKEL